MLIVEKYLYYFLTHSFYNEINLNEWIILNIQYKLNLRNFIYKNEYAINVIYVNKEKISK